MEKELDFDGIKDAYSLIGEITTFSNRFQTVADKFFKDISWKQFFALICIKLFEDKPTINELSAVLGSSHQNVKQLLLKLQTAGYIEFVKDQGDRRKQRITRTEKADLFDRNHAEASDIYMNKFFENISPEKIKFTIETLAQLEQNLKKMED